MQLVLTLIADPAAPALTPTLADGVRAALAAAGASCGAPDWLAPDVACDLPFDGLDPARAEAAAAEALGDQPIDLAVQPRDDRRKRLLVADMDSTVVTSETLDDLAAFAGLKDRIAPITARTMAGELDFAQSLRARVAMLAGLPVSTLDEAAAQVVLSPGARVLVQTMRAHGAHTALVSGGFTDFTGRIRDACGFHDHQANRFVVENGVLAGRVEEPILDRDAKLTLLNRLCADLGLTPNAACSVGDGANDIAMLSAAGLGVAYHAKPKTRAAARVRVDHGDLTALLYLQGYRRAEFTGA